MTARLAIKVVPGASRDRVVGRLGDAIKLQVTAPAEHGKANRAVIKLLSDTLGLRQSDLAIVSGESNSRKIISINGLSQALLEQRLSGIL